MGDAFSIMFHPSPLHADHPPSLAGSERSDESAHVLAVRGLMRRNSSIGSHVEEDDNAAGGVGIGSSAVRCNERQVEEEDDEQDNRCFFASFWWHNRRPSHVLLEFENETTALSDSSFTAEGTGPEGNVSNSCYYSINPTMSPQSSLFQSSGSLDQLEYTAEELELPCTPTRASDLSRNRPIWIVTTASLPWMTGTAVNPLLRAKALSRTHDRVTLVLPWLESAVDRETLYGAEWRDKTQSDQQHYLQTTWLKEDARNVALLFYPAKHHPLLSSVFALGDLCELLPACEDGVCILEEPEHVNFYRAPGVIGWRQKFSHVIGIVHTNYKAYAEHHYSGLLTGPIVGKLSSVMVRAYCDKVIKLSGVLQDYAVEKEVVENVHGIRSDFLIPPLHLTGYKVYFIGKLLWCKGLDKLLMLQDYFYRMTGNYFEIDVFGSGPEENEIQQAFGQSSATSSTKMTVAACTWRRRRMPVKFPGRIDHLSVGENYKIFINPSVTEVLCTTTAEAIARGRFVLVPHHPSNAFFAQFPNCLQYKSKEDFCALFQFAKSHDPTPLSAEQHYVLTWEAATDRLIQASGVSQRDQARRDRIGLRLDERAAKWHYDWGRGKTGDVIRTVMGGGPVAAQHQFCVRPVTCAPTSPSSSVS